MPCPEPMAAGWSTPPPFCISYAEVRNYCGPCAYCGLDKGVACAQHIQLPQGELVQERGIGTTNIPKIRAMWVQVGKDAQQMCP